MDLKGKKIVVVGFGDKTGPALLRYLAACGARPAVSELRPAEACAASLASVADLAFEREFGGHSATRILSAELIVLSPGVRPDAEILVKAAKMAIPIVSEIELAYAGLRCPLLAITGTNGKSTVTTLVGQMLKNSGRRVFCGGNLGTPLIEAALPGAAPDVAVAEVSSFQLSAIRTFRPKVAALLNCTPDHLDWHRDLAEYERAKSRIFENMNESDQAVLNAADSLCRRLAPSLAARAHWFSHGPLKGFGAAATPAGFSIRTAPLRATFRLDNPSLRGTHNRENAMAAALCAALGGADAAAIQRALDEFRALPHRVQFVAAIGGVDYFDDSKGTNPDAVARAIEAVGKAVVLIAGGKEKNLDYAAVAAALKKHRGKAVICMGESGRRLYDFFAPAFPVKRAHSMEEAVRLASQIAVAGEAVLLSSGTSSFDAYRGYGERGDHFQRCVRDLAGGGE